MIILSNNKYFNVLIPHDNAASFRNVSSSQIYFTFRTKAILSETRRDSVKIAERASTA